MIEEIHPGVFMVEHRWAEGKNGVILGKRRAIAIDTGSDLNDGQRLVDLIRTR
jgi:hypothetical protein